MSRKPLTLGAVIKDMVRREPLMGSHSGAGMKDLARWRFPTAAVLRAASLSPMGLGNVTSKSPLILCSESAGQGRSRQFCLVDVYQLALLTRLSLLTGRWSWSAEACNRLLLPDLYAHNPAPEYWPKIAQSPECATARAKLCEDPAANLPALYTDRGEQPWFVFADERRLTGSIPELNFARADDGDRVLTEILGGCAIINVTYFLDAVDLELARQMGLKNEDLNA